jgi:hypothetical protein
MTPLSILITNCTLNGRTGSETATRDLALELQARMHRPAVYSPQLGPLAKELQRADIPVFDKLSPSVEVPDIIHGHHHPETVTAVFYFRDVPAVFVCHNPFAWIDHPPNIKRVRQFVAVDILRRDRLLSNSWIAPEDVSIIPNGVDTNRFRSRNTPLPARPQQALLFSNYATSTNYGAHLVSLASSLGLSLDVMGTGFAAACEAPERQLVQYDIVFAVGRAAMEAMACGAACILCDREGLGPLVTPTNVQHLWEYNFGHVLLQQRLTREGLAEQLDRYSPHEAGAVQDFIRQHACLRKSVDRYESLYEKVLGDKQDLPLLGDDIRMYTESLCQEVGILRAQVQSQQGKPYSW